MSITSNQSDSNKDELNNNYKLYILIYISCNFYNLYKILSFYSFFESISNYMFL